MAVTTALSCAEFTLTTTAVTSNATEIVADPGSTSVSRRINLTFANKTATDAFVDVVRWNGTTPFAAAQGKKVPANDSLVLTDLALTNGKSLRARASVGSAIDVLVDVVTRTETP